MFTNTERYQFKFLVYLIKREHDDFITLSEISDETDIPRGYLGELAQKLSSERLLLSKRGIHGGIKLNFDPDDWSLGKLIRRIGMIDHAAEPGPDCCVPAGFDQCFVRRLEEKIDDRDFLQCQVGDFVKNKLCFD